MKLKILTIIFSICLLLVAFGFFSYKTTLPVEYQSGAVLNNEPIIKPEVVHVETPSEVKGIYMTQCVADLPDFREKLAKLIHETELNSVIVDIKDYTGTVSFKTGDQSIDTVGGRGCVAEDMKEFIKELHDKNIYVIGRITVFQDPQYTKLHPELAVKRKSDKKVWKDRKGLSFIDVGAREYWDYIINISKQSEKIGFDEINFDYIRFPSDGDMTDIAFTHTGTTTKKEMLRQFFEYLDSELKDTKIKTSADLFGMVTTNVDDLGIGQVLENALPYFDFIAPMVYPSHYPSKFNGWPDPNKVPYEIVKFSMTSAIKRVEYLATTTRASLLSTTTPTKYPRRNIDRIRKEQLRPWLQDNDYPVHYTADMVRKQIQATYDAGLTSWMLWDPANTYTRDALIFE